MNEKLCMDFSEEEIGITLFHIGLLQAPRRDGFPQEFLSNTVEFLRMIPAAVKEFFSA
jgi:hypothetical protein